MDTCPLSNHSVELRQDGHTMCYSYDIPDVGTVEWTDVAWGMRLALNQPQKNILKGLIRNRKEKQQGPLAINAQLLASLDNLEIPYDFEGKAKHFVQYLYGNGGKHFKAHLISSSRDSAITYSSREEFDSIVHYLKTDGVLDYEKSTVTRETTLYKGLSLTKKGIEVVEKNEGTIFSFSTLDQKISTGDLAADREIEHAKELFLREPRTLQNLRSACESLIFVLEPLRKDLKALFSGDTEVFFQIVNDFTIRHNKERTKSIEFPEQLEWIFYSLLNTINTYVRLKRRLP